MIRHLSVGDLLACVSWFLLCAVVRREYRAQKRSDGIGWKGPGA